MEDIKRLSALLIAASMLTANMTCALVSADEISDAGDVQSPVTVSAEDIDTSEDVNSDPDMISDGDEERHDDQDDISGEDQSNQDTAADAAGDEELFAGDAENSSSTEGQDADRAAFGAEVLGDSAAVPDDVSAVNKGRGDLEGLVNTKIFQVTLPVQNDSLDYVADPQGLIRKTNAEKHPDCIYSEKANVYFNNGSGTDGNGRIVTRFSNASDPLIVVNKSSTAVSVVARVSAYYEQDAQNPVALAGSRDWESYDKPAVYLAAVRSDDGSEVVLSKTEKVITATIAGSQDAYKYVCEETDGEKKYGYRLMTDEEMQSAQIQFKTFSLQLTGECNSECDWDPDAEYDFPSTSIVWNVGLAASAKPYVNEGNYTVALDSAIKIPYSLGLYDDAATGFTSAELTTPSGEVMQILGITDFMDFTDNEIVLSEAFSEYARSLGGGTLKFVFDDPAKTAASITLDDGCAPYLEKTEFTVTSKTKELYVPFKYGIGEKAARNVASVKFGNNDFSNKAYLSLSGNGFTLKATALRRIIDRNGGKVSVTFDDPDRTRCVFEVNME